ncbi:hypothetical protein PGT21_019689 [Puccinia graminis f. sp. tritici]|uniref:Uncharacterized protein n=1 Tax=Puccinia graminis f. sp. tritici TaxID=56615 RepID=A0A5B0M0K3_PUCGR|nr:hypothetical protein PGT21_019689 [Puccinia graminis f. sp. tritici]
MTKTAQVSLIPSPLGLSPVDIVVGLNVGLRALLFSPIRRKVLLKRATRDLIISG